MNSEQKQKEQEDKNHRKAIKRQISELEAMTDATSNCHELFKQTAKQLLNKFYDYRKIINKRMPKEKDYEKFCDLTIKVIEFYDAVKNNDYNFAKNYNQKQYNQAQEKHNQAQEQYNQTQDSQARPQEATTHEVPPELLDLKKGQEPQLESKPVQTSAKEQYEHKIIQLNQDIKNNSEYQGVKNDSEYQGVENDSKYQNSPKELTNSVQDSYLDEEERKREVVNNIINNKAKEQQEKDYTAQKKAELAPDPSKPTPEEKRQEKQIKDRLKKKGIKFDSTGEWAVITPSPIPILGKEYDS